MRAQFINEEAGPKDIIRMESLRDKSKGDHDKELQYAYNMAKSIKNPGKAQARGEGAEEVFGDTEIANIFYNRAQELAGGASVTAEPSQIPGTPKPKFDYNQYRKPVSKRGFERSEDPESAAANPFAKLGIGSFRKGAYNDDITPKRDKKHHGRAWGSRGVAILTIGTVNLQTGEAADNFNVIDTWDPNDTVGEIWQNEKGKYKIMITSGNKPLHQIGDTASFIADQSLRYLYDATMVDWTLMKDLPGLVPYYGKRIGGYVYK